MSGFPSLASPDQYMKWKKNKNKTKHKKPAWWIFSLLLSKQPHGNFNLTGGEKQHMIWMGRCETSVSLLRPEPHCSSQTPSGRFITPPVSPRSHDTNHTAHRHRQGLGFFLWALILPGVQLTFKHNTWCDRLNFLKGRAYRSWVNIDHAYSLHTEKKKEKNNSPLPSAYFNSSLKPPHTGETN